jgi:hypothetical protein
MLLRSRSGVGGWGIPVSAIPRLLPHVEHSIVARSLRLKRQRENRPPVVNSAFDEVGVAYFERMTRRHPNPR